MSHNFEIGIDHLTKIEGHAKLTAKVENNEVKEAAIEVFESSRFFEAMLRNRKYYEAASISSRICGICSVIHHIVSLKAVENALNIKPSQQTIDLRKLLVFASNIHSHVAHLYFMALPDYLGYESALSMVPKRKDDVKRGFRIEKSSTDIVTLISARAIHPMTAKLGGFTTVPTKSKLELILKKLKEMKDDAKKTAEIFSSLKIPNFNNKTRYFALTKENDYPLYDGKVLSLNGFNLNIKNYKKILKEKVKYHSTAKHVLFNGKSFMVGALARLNINHKNLSDDAKELLNKSGIKLPSFNPFDNNFAQALEIVHFIDKGIEIVENFLDSGLRSEKVKIEPKEGDGIAVGEAPRGILYHHYSFDDRGIIKNANIITPTAQNLMNMEEDIKKFLPQILSLSKDKINLELEKLIRAYDPCISCSAHFLEVEFI